jgi:hypothetical protein
VEVGPKKLKGKRDLIMPKSFQQVDFWCKWSWGLRVAPPYTLPHPGRGFAARVPMIGTYPLYARPGAGLSEFSHHEPPR